MLHSKSFFIHRILPDTFYISQYNLKPLMFCPCRILANIFNLWFTA